MLWFRLASGIFLLVITLWTMGVISGVVQMISYGTSMRSMVEDPTRNGTISVYVTLVAIESFIFFISIYGIFVGFRMWRNNFQIDHALRHQFIIWLGCWGIGFVFCLIIGIYMVIKAKDNQENMAILYDTFFRNSQDQKFVSTFEKFQREYQCCGIYTPNDWLMIQLRQRGGAGGGGGGFQDYDNYNQNPSTGKCHMQAPILPPGCGVKINEEIQFRMKIYAACAITQTIIGAFTGALFWYCFFYWLEKDVIVIPEDEVSNLIIIEPESEATIESGSSSSHGSVYHSRSGVGHSRQSSRFSGSRVPSSRYSNRRTSNGGYLHQGSYMHHSASHHHEHHHKIHLSHTQILHEQEQALGGKVLAEMHVEHKSTEMLKAQGSNAGQHHATVAIVRNKNPPKKNDFKSKGHKGQTGNLARDIADMSGQPAKGYIEDVVIPVEKPGHKPRAIQIPLGASVHSRPPSNTKANLRRSVKGFNFQDQIEGIISPKEREDKKSHKSVFIPTKAHHHHHQHVAPNHDPEKVITEPQILPPIGSHESAFQAHHHHEHQHHISEVIEHHHRSEHEGSQHRRGSSFDGSRHDRYLGSGTDEHHHHGSGVIEHHHGSGVVEHHHGSGVVEHHHHGSGVSEHHHHGSGIAEHHHHGSGVVEHHHHGSGVAEHHHHGSGVAEHHHRGSNEHHHHGSGVVEHHHGGSFNHHHGHENHHHDYERYMPHGHEHHHHDGGSRGHGPFSPTDRRSSTSRRRHAHRHSRKFSNPESRDFHRTTTVLFKNPRVLDDSD